MRPLKININIWLTNASEMYRQSALPYVRLRIQQRRYSCHFGAIVKVCFESGTFQSWLYTKVKIAENIFLFLMINPGLTQTSDSKAFVASFSLSPVFGNLFLLQLIASRWPFALMGFFSGLWFSILIDCCELFAILNWGFVICSQFASSLLALKGPYGIPRCI